jgi:propanediol dehydratase large subunit
MAKSKRIAKAQERNIHQDSFIAPWPEAGLVIADSPADPKPGLCIQNGVITEMDGVAAENFDIIDRFIAAHAIDTNAAEQSMAMDDRTAAGMLVDIHVPREDVVRVVLGMTPAKIMAVIRHLTVVDMMMAMQKMRVRRTPGNQAHVTNRRENPVLLAADAAEAVLRGFSEIETTVGISRYAPLNALAILIGSQVAPGAALTQCAVEESLGLTLAMRGLTSYAETLSIYGTERALIDGDDTPWSKAFLNAAYASRGAKVRFTSGGGSEALMGHAGGQSMLYLETRCLLMTRAAGSQGIQNGSISCIALPSAVPGGIRGVMAENLIAAMLDLEVAAGNDAMSSHSDIRKSAKLMCQFLPGTDFVTSGYSLIPRRDNMFGGGNFDAYDLPDWEVLQRDFSVNAGIMPAAEQDVTTVRRRAAEAVQAVFEELKLPPISRIEIKAAIIADGSEDMPNRDATADIEAAGEFLAESRTALDIIRALDARGFTDIADRLVRVTQLRASGDCLQTSAMVTPDLQVLSAVNDPNTYLGPGSGYTPDDATRQRLDAIPSAEDPHDILQSIQSGDTLLEETGPAQTSQAPDDLVIALGAAFGNTITHTIGGLSHREVLNAVIAGVRSEDMEPRLVKIYQTSDCGALGLVGAKLSGSGISVGIQSKGTTIIHQRDLPPLDNLELFPQAPLLTVASYFTIGKNAARYAKSLSVQPVPTRIDNMARLRLIVKTTLMHAVETGLLDTAKGAVAVEMLPPES